jgi:hypothetical protein
VEPVRIYGFHHVALMVNWQEVIEEQAALLSRSGLGEKTNFCYATILGTEGGPDPADLWGERTNFMVYRMPDILKFEFPTLQRMWLLAQEEEFYCYYIHTKGVRLGNPPPIRDWRHMMEYFVIERWQDAVAKLDEGYDCVGCEPGRMPWEEPRNYFHYGGNFWWATSEHIRRLPPIENLNPHHREEAEAWIGMAGDPNYYVAYRSGVDHNHSGLPRKEYEGKGYE